MKGWLGGRLAEGMTGLAKAGAAGSAGGRCCCRGGPLASKNGATGEIVEKNVHVARQKKPYKSPLTVIDWKPDHRERKLLSK